jgi:2,4-dienoyl-CoA reductase (NADPH2)
VIGGGAVGLDAALYLSAKGTIDAETLHFLMFHRAETDERLHDLLENGSKQVVVFEKLRKAGKDLGRSSRWVVMLEAEKYGVDIRTSVQVDSIDADGTLQLTRIMPDKSTQKTSEKFDSVVLALGANPVDVLTGKLEKAGVKVKHIGDCVRPARIIDAIEQARAAAREI